MEESEMNVSELMNTDVLTAVPDESLRNVARRLVKHGISGVPVCDEGRLVVGVISEGDILYKERGRTGRRRPLAGIVDSAARAEMIKMQARTVREAMTSPAITITPSRAAAYAARLMLDNAVNRLPVVTKGGRLVGILTRADLVRAFARPDAEIATEIRADILNRVFWVQPETIRVEVNDGAVRIAGEIETATEAEVLLSLVEKVPGVVAVDSTVTSRNP